MTFLGGALPPWDRPRVTLRAVLKLGSLRVAIHPNDHRPAHVHIIGPDHEAVFLLHCPNGPPELRNNYGFDIGELRRIEAHLAAARDTAL